MKCVIYGRGGAGRELWHLLSFQKDPALSFQYEPVCFIDDFKNGDSVYNLPVMSLGEASRIYPSERLFCGVGECAPRELMIRRAWEMGFDCSANCVGSPLSPYTTIGHGMVIGTNNTITVDNKIGCYVLIFSQCSVAHDVEIGDYSTLTYGVNISGYVKVGKRVFFGTNSCVINGTPENPIVIGDDVIVGAGACVTKSIPSGRTVKGVPAR